MTPTSVPTKRAAREARLLRGFVGVLVITAVACVIILWPRQGTLSTFHIPWWLFAILFYLTETCLVHLYFRTGAHSFSMSEIPVILGLFFATPRELVVGQFVGCAVALAIQRRQTAVKAAFNLANFAVTTTVAIVVTRAILAPGHQLGLVAWGTAALAALVYASLSSLTVNIAIALSENRVEPLRQLQAFLMLLGSSLTNLSLGLVAATVLDYRPQAAWILIIPAATVFLAYKAYIREREKHEILEFLYATNRLLTQNPDLEQAIVALLDQAKTMFRAGVAEAVIAPPDGASLLRVRLSSDGDPQTIEAVNDSAILAMWEHVSGEKAPVLIGSKERRSPLRWRTDKHSWPQTQDSDYLTTLGVRNAMLAPLRGEARAMGMLVMAERLGEPAAFQREDVRLFEALASHVSVALENGRLEQSLSHLRELERRLTQLAFHDPLTGLANRSLFSERVVEALATARAEARTCAVLFIDLDDFKTVNDTLGHEAGDQLLKAVAERITGCLRPTDQPARLGGDEFAVIIEDALAGQAAERIAARITDALRQPVRVNNCDLYLRASIGIATSQDVNSADEMLRNADLAMYMAKADGKGRYRWFRSSMRTDVVERHQLKSDLERANGRGEFQVHYQPIVDLRTGRPVAAEALVRWAHPERGLIFPASFIPAAERSGLINEIGRFVLRTACKHVAEWVDIATPNDRPFAVTVNLSPAQFAQPDLVAQVEQAVDDAGIDPACLVLEITEGLMLQGSDRVLRTLDRLSGFGVRMAMDDFGTGYASLSSLRELPMDMIKIAKTFTDDISGNEEKSPFVRAMIELGESLGLITLAEGIETGQQARELERLGCQLGQGYHFARPIPATGIELLLRRHAEESSKLAKVIAFPA